MANEWLLYFNIKNYKYVNKELVFIFFRGKKAKYGDNLLADDFQNSSSPSYSKILDRESNNSEKPLIDLDQEDKDR